MKHLDDDDYMLQFLLQMTRTSSTIGHDCQRKLIVTGNLSDERLIKREKKKTSSAAVIKKWRRK